MKKKCNSCNKILDISLFSVYKNFYASFCKKCKSKKAQEKKKTIDGLITKIYGKQKASSRKRNHPEPEYTNKELNSWCKKSNNFLSIYSDWEKSNYESELIPSIDRLDDNLPYSFNNIQVLSWKEHKKKTYNGTRTKHNKHKGKKVVKKDLNGNIIKKFISGAEAAREINVNTATITKACNKIVKGFIYEYE